MNSIKLNETICNSILKIFESEPLFVLTYENISIYFKHDNKKIVQWFFCENKDLHNLRPIEYFILGEDKYLIEQLFGVKNL